MLNQIIQSLCVKLFAKGLFFLKSCNLFTYKYNNNGVINLSGSIRQLKQSIEGGSLATTNGAIISVPAVFLGTRTAIRSMV